MIVIKVHLSDQNHHHQHNCHCHHDHHHENQLVRNHLMQANTQQTYLKAGQVKVALSKPSIIEEYEEKNIRQHEAI